MGISGPKFGGTVMNCLFLFIALGVASGLIHDAVPTKPVIPAYDAIITNVLDHHRVICSSPNQRFTTLWISDTSGSDIKEVMELPCFDV